MPSGNVYQSGSSSGSTIKYCSDQDKACLTNNFERKGWIHVAPDDDWNFYWSVEKVFPCVISPVNSVLPWAKMRSLVR